MHLVWLIGRSITMAVTLAKKYLMGADHYFSDTLPVNPE